MGAPAKTALEYGCQPGIISKIDAYKRISGIKTEEILYEEYSIRPMIKTPPAAVKPNR